MTMANEGIPYVNTFAPQTIILSSKMSKIFKNFTFSAFLLHKLMLLRFDFMIEIGVILGFHLMN